MPTIWNPADRASLIARFERLSPDATPKWGSFSAPRMVAHITDAVRSAIGELHVAPKKSPLATWPLNVLVMHYLPWPKGAPTAPELIARTPAEWEAELSTLKDAFARFAGKHRDEPWPNHAAFGNIGPDGWGRLMYRHTDHHLKQFGV